MAASLAAPVPVMYARRRAHSIRFPSGRWRTMSGWVTPDRNNPLPPVQFQFVGRTGPKMMQTKRRNSAPSDQSRASTEKLPPTIVNRKARGWPFRAPQLMRRHGAVYFPVAGGYGASAPRVLRLSLR
jgi:hypothetical protein